MKHSSKLKSALKLLSENAIPLIITTSIIISESFYFMLFPKMDLHEISLDKISELLKFLPEAILVFIFMLVYFSEEHVRKQELNALKKVYVLFIIIILSCIGLFMLLSHFSHANIIGAIYYFLFVACFEEFFFRAYLYRNIKTKSSFKVAVILSGVVFGLAHGFFRWIALGYRWYEVFSQVFGTGILGTLLFAFTYEKSGTILVPILLHFVLDYSGFVW